MDFEEWIFHSGLHVDCVTRQYLKIAYEAKDSEIERLKENLSRVKEELDKIKAILVSVTDFGIK